MHSDSGVAASTDGLDDEFAAELIDIFEQRITFNKTLGLKILRMGADGAQCALRMRPELIGHYAYGRLHGGVISAVLDATAGLAVMAAIGAQNQARSPARRLQRFERLGTIDLRVDYLRPALGPGFVAHAEVTRLGSRVATTRMTFCADDDTVLSTGAAAYIVS